MTIDTETPAAPAPMPVLEAQPFEGMTAVLGKPENWDKSKHGPCLGLPVMQREDGACVSAWRPTPECLEKLNAGGWVYLFVVSGPSMPPVAMVVDDAHPLSGEMAEIVEQALGEIAS